MSDSVKAPEEAKTPAKKKQPAAKAPETVLYVGPTINGIAITGTV